MKNPIYYEYKRASVLGAYLVLILASVGATLHYLSSVDEQVLYNKNKLDAASQQFDSQMAPLLAFAQSMRRAALLKLALEPAPEAEYLTLLSLESGQTSVQTATAEQPEWLMLQKLQPYFELLSDAQAVVIASYYVSAQGVAYNGSEKWSDYRAESLILWHKQRAKTVQFETDLVFEPRFSAQHAAVVVPLNYQGKLLGSFVYVLDTEAMLAPIFSHFPLLDFMLLDQSGAVITGSQAQPPQSVAQHLLHIQRLNTVPWSLAVIERKTNVFAAGLATFFLHWFSYALLLTILLLAMRYRFKTRTLSPVSRLLIHVERLAEGQSRGVRHIPHGWTEIFDQIYHLHDKPKDSSE
uniref:Uncharacterized protein n=1 Tax=Rheinheimera sp. BAL341 TaxID=1708203 RepID=A0A486XSN3_9GAMM